MNGYNIYDKDSAEDVKNGIISIEEEINSKIEDNSITKEEIVRLRYLQMLESMKLQISDFGKKVYF